MELVSIVDVAARPLHRLTELGDAAEAQRLSAAATRLFKNLKGALVWNVNSTAHGGGVAELLRSLVAYARGAGIDCRWAVIGGGPEFFTLTKRLHNAAHGIAGDDSLLGEAGRAIYESWSTRNVSGLLCQVRPRDVIILHDPQTLGLAPALSRRGARVIWRCHVGPDRPNEHSRAAFRFLAPYLEHAEACVFTRAAYVPDNVALRNVHVIVPTIDPLATKNAHLSDKAARAILVHTGLLEGPPTETLPEFTRSDGSVSRVDHGADIIRLGPAYRGDVPLVVQISRWDRLKDHAGVLQGFAKYIVEQRGPARLILAGPNVNAVADDPEGAEVFGEVLAAYRELPHAIRTHVELANLPMSDDEENAAIVNALQEKATVIVQKSLQEGFGLTVAEAMWKAKPVIGSRVGGIQDQIEDGISGLLLDDPRDSQAFATALTRVLGNPAYAEKLGAAAHKRTRERFLSLCSLLAYADLISNLIERS